jgi:hypothetical protein
MKHTFFLSALLLNIFWTLPAFAQEDTPLPERREGSLEYRKPPHKIIWSADFKEPASSDFSKIIGTENGGFFVLRQQRSSFLGMGDVEPVVEFYNENLKLVSAQAFDLTYKGKKRKLKDVVMLSGRLWLLSYFYNEKHEKTYLFAQEIKKTNLSLSKEIIMISEQDETNRERDDVFSFAMSRDSSKLVVFTRESGSTDNVLFQINVLDADFNSVWQRKAQLPFNDFRVEETHISAKGDVYLLGIVQTEGGNTSIFRTRSGQYKYHLMAYMAGDETTKGKKIAIDLPNKFLSDLTLRLADDNQLVFAGFYSEKSRSSMKGTCLFSLDPQNLEAKPEFKTTEFSFEFLTQNLSERSRERARTAIERDDKKSEPELLNYSLDKLILRSDGGVLLVAEQFFIDERFNNMNDFGSSIYSPWYNPWNDPYRWNNRGAQRSEFYFNYNDILVVNIAPDGTIDWASRIPKRQISVNDGGLFSSYTMSTVQDKLYFMYNEDPRNLATKKISAETPDGNSVVVLAEVGQDGAVRKQPFFTNRETGVIMRPKICRQIGKREMLVYSEKNGKFRFAEIAFE